MALSGDIVDAASGGPVAAAVYINDALVQEQTTMVNVVVPLRGLEAVTLRVEAPGYEVWEMRISSDGSGSKELRGPVRLRRKPGFNNKT
jgi:hypothetical protein